MRATEASPRDEDPMTLSTQAVPSTLRLPSATPVIDRLTADGRSALLGLLWASWYSSRGETSRRLLAGIGSDDAVEAARAAGVTTEATLRLLRLRRVTAGDPHVKAIVDGLLDGAPVLHVPSSLRRVLASSDTERLCMLQRVRAELAVQPHEDLEVLAAVTAYLVSTEVDYEQALVREDALARGQARAVLAALGLPAYAYMPRLRSWL